MADLHWSERRALERMVRYTKQRAEKDRPDQELVAKLSSPEEILDAIIELVEHQRFNMAKDALEDRSKYPQRLDGAAHAYDLLLEHDLYPIRERMTLIAGE